MLTYQEKVSFLAGNQSGKFSSDRSGIIFPQQSAKTLADVSAKIYANQLPKFTGNQSGEYFSGYKSGDILRYSNLSRSKGGEFTPFAKGDFSHLSKVGKFRSLNSFISKNGKIEFCQSIKGKVIEFLESIKKGNLEKCVIHHLRLWVIVGYSKNALAKSSVRIGVLNNILATHDAPSVFFCVHAYAHLLNAVLYRAYSMVAAVEQPKGWLVSLMSSYANSAVVTTPEIGVSSGDSLQNIKEIIVMMATPTQTQFKFLFLSIKRSDTTAKPCRIAVTAPNEHDARLMLVRDYILSFAGRLPTQEVTA
ncbi:host cell division inhibitor Icd-like protein [Moellerella wisconsensis]|uniref:host cell division inhibitor Icd-like protein n=1 Tax=Moellerella wisconsensis TaxID=158849 RepID=UPI001F4DB52F|nr:host cell division inhibitor Icd-like protein [Moellerella wisconsensis]UNH28459.1 host cell division inhibitor Icd-like protein [Moellerella wisconsensis]